MSRITKIEIAVAVVGALTFAGMAAIAPPAYAEGTNPYLPTPAASSETPDHGRANYCAIQTAVPFWTCDQELALNGNGEGNKAGLPAREGRHHVDKPSKPVCEPKTKA